MQRKQSFLERLTGTMHIDETEEINNQIATDSEARRWEDGRERREHPEESYSDEPEADTEHEEMEEEDDDVGQLAIDMYESDNELVIQSMVAGVTPEHLNITITRDSVSIRGKRVAPHGISDDQFIDRELFWGEFSRTIDLPFEINTDGAEAVEKYGLLIIRLPKIDVSRSAELKVKSI